MTAIQKEFMKTFLSTNQLEKQLYDRENRKANYPSKIELETNQ